MIFFIVCNVHSKNSPKIGQEFSKTHIVHCPRLCAAAAVKAQPSRVLYCGRTNSSQKSPKTANNPWLKPNERDIVFRLHDAQFSNPALLVIQIEKVIWPRRFSCIDCSIAKTSSLHCAPPHKGLNLLKRFTNLLSGSMSLILS